MIKAFDAMVRAIQFADAGQAELAAVWVSIARELREGSVPGPVAMPGKPVSQQDLAEIRQSFRDTSDRTAATEVMPASINLGELCANCGYQIELADGGIRHTRTGQSVCPVPTNVDGTYTFATPDTSGTA
jgi:carotenoid cleavage dioxygenase-like enzyme